MVPGFCARAPAVCAQQVVDQHLGVDLFLDVERRGVDDEVAPVLLILAAPDELRIEVAVAALVGHADRVLLVLLHHRLVFGGGDVLPRGLVVLERFDGLAVVACFLAIVLSSSLFNLQCNVRSVCIPVGRDLPDFLESAAIAGRCRLSDGVEVL